VPLPSRRSSRTAAGLLAALALAACSSPDSEPTASTAGPTPGAVIPSGTAESPAAAAPEAPRARPPAVPVQELRQRLRPDVLVLAPEGLAPDTVSQLLALAPDRAVAFRSGTVKVADEDVRAVGVDPSAFRAFAGEGTAESTPVWESVARGELVVAHERAAALGLQLGEDIPTAGVTGVPVPLRLGALATAGVPGADLVVDDATAGRLGLPASNAVLLMAGDATDPGGLAEQARGIAGPGATVELLTPRVVNPVAFLTGGKAAEAFGSFSYRYFPDGTIAPEPDWIRQNIRTETVPIMGSVTCHRLMLPQLRGALQEVVAAGLGSSLTTYDGCYVPRFIERNPEGSISLHTWGIAIDMDASTNYRGIRGTMDPRIVEIFKRWGFRWGGDWKYTDPMHFELVALLTPGKS
jgi:hypothetical protein